MRAFRSAGAGLRGCRRARSRSAGLVVRARATPACLYRRVDRAAPGVDVRDRLGPGGRGRRWALVWRRPLRPRRGYTAAACGRPRSRLGWALRAGSPYLLPVRGTDETGGRPRRGDTTLAAAAGRRRDRCLAVVLPAIARPALAGLVLRGAARPGATSRSTSASRPLGAPDDRPGAPVKPRGRWRCSCSPAFAVGVVLMIVFEAPVTRIVGVTRPVRVHRLRGVP